MDIKEIVKILPHRYPFLLVDRILHYDLEKGEIIGQKNLTINEQFFQGHFPDAPIMPGVLILEALAQTGGILVSLKQETGKIAVLMNINNAKFRRPVKPGDVLKMQCEILQLGSKGGKVRGLGFIGDNLAAEVEMGYALVHKEQI